MTLRRNLYLSAAAIAVAGCLVYAPAHAQSAVRIDNHDIGGVVTGAHGPEAGVWVIAETHDLPTRYAKMVVTDDQGRYVVPDLPQAHYKVWVRGYGLIDSPKVDADPGKQLDLTAVPAPNDAAAAQYLSGDLLVFDAENSGSPTSSAARAIFRKRPSCPTGSTLMKNNGCIGCHQLGDIATRTIPADARQIRILRRRLGAPHAVGTVRPDDGQHHRRPIRTRFRSNTSPIGPTASPRANCLR